MNWKKVTGALLVLIGAALIVFGSIISKKVKQGEKKIQKSQNTVNTLRDFSKINPNTRKIVRIATKPAQQKINQGKKKASRYNVVSIWSLISGIVIATFGAIFLIFGFLRATKKRR